MDNADTDADRLPARVFFLNALRTSELLRKVHPGLRIDAIFETLWYCRDDTSVIQIMLDCITDSPYIPDDKKCFFAELTLTSQFAELSRALKCEELVEQARNPSGLDDSFLRFRAMVVLLFTRSRKIQLLPEARKTALGLAFHMATSKEQIHDIALHALTTSTLFDEAGRSTIANNILENRYDLLLLSDCFDCEVIPRRARPQAKSETTAAAMVPSDITTATVGAPAVMSANCVAMLEECPICLGSNMTDCCLRCPARHAFCRSCITAWIQTNGSCPLCRFKTLQKSDILSLEGTSDASAAPRSQLPLAEELQTVTSQTPARVVPIGPVGAQLNVMIVCYLFFYLKIANLTSLLISFTLFIDVQLLMPYSAISMSPIFGKSTNNYYNPISEVGRVWAEMGKHQGAP